MSVDYVVPFYGDREKWESLAERALRSVTSQLGVCHVSYGSTLAEARNDGAAQGCGEWIVFVDADDELEPNFCELMWWVTSANDGWDAFTPQVRYVNDEWGTETEPDFIPPRPLRTGNYLIIGTAIRRDDFEHVGGFKEWPIYEDWDLFRRIEMTHSRELRVAPVHGAVYRAHQKAGDPGRNLQEERLRRRVRAEIEASWRS